jgi:AraC family transcriptional regulator
MPAETMNAEPFQDVDFDRIVFRSEHLTVGQFRARPEHPRFADSGPASGFLIVFPRTVVGIQHEGCEPFVSSPPTANFYNRDQRYVRRRISGEGDRCDWFSPSQVLLHEVLGELGMRPANPDGAVFRVSHAPCAAPVYLAQRRFVQTCVDSLPPDAMAAEEFASSLALHFLDPARCSEAPTRRRRNPGPHRRRSLERVEAAKDLLSRHYMENWSLSEIARRLGCSGPHLCRKFRASCGVGMHAFREQIRLRCALERLADFSRDFSSLAVDLGFSHHSHFTFAFRRAFGCTPSALLGRRGRSPFHLVSRAG